MENKKEILECACYSNEHMYVIGYIEDKLVYISPHLQSKSFWYRLKYAIKYIFGYKCMFGCFDEILISKSNYKPLKNIVEFIEKSEE